MIYVGLDLETTDLHPENGDIIEIGACKYENGKLIGSFQFLIRPSHEVPSIVSAITGIGEQELKEAVELDTVVDDLRDFVSDYPIIGHNIAFDIGFLKAKGVDFTKNLHLDTWKLATLVVDSSPSLSLEVLTKQLGIAHSDSHRAYDDACASVELFYALVGYIDQLSLRAIKAVVEYLSDKDYPFYSYFKEAYEKKSNAASQASLDLPEALQRTVDIDLQSVEAIFEENSTPSRVYLHKDQYSFVERIVEMAHEGKHSIIDTSKWVHQGLCALIAAGALEEKSVIYVHSYADREQLLDQDARLFHEITGKYIHPLYVGKPEEYFCYQKFESYLNSRDHSEAEIHLIAKVLLWLSETRTGLLSELNANYEEYRFIDMFRADASCSNNKSCSKDSDCFYAKMRSSKDDSGVIVKMHNQLFTGEAVVDRHRFVLSSQKLDRSFEAAFKTFLNTNALERPLITLRDVSESAEIAERIDELIAHIQLVLGLLGMHTTKYARFDYGKAVVNAEYLSFLKDVGVYEAILRVEDMFELILAEFKSSNPQLEAAHTVISSFIAFFTEKNEYLQEVRVGEEHVHLSQVPIKEFYDFFLKPEGISDHFIGKSIYVGAHTVLDALVDHAAFETVSFDGNISYSQNLELVAVRDFEYEASEKYYEALHQLILSVSAGDDRGVLVVMKNKNKITQYYKKFGYENKKGKQSVYYAGVQGGGDKVFAMMKGVKKPILFITSFDLERSSIDPELFGTFVLDRLPFQPPTPHEIKTGEGDFMSVALPRATRAFKTIVESAVAHPEDTARFIILDQKAISARYAQFFFDAIGFDGVKAVSMRDLES